MGAQKGKPLSSQGGWAGASDIVSGAETRPEPGYIRTPFGLIRSSRLSSESNPEERISNIKMRLQNLREQRPEETEERISSTRASLQNLREQRPEETEEKIRSTRMKLQSLRAKRDRGA